ncbi:MAG: entericidin A/B family lipoprotein [Legionella sp.]
MKKMIVVGVLVAVTTMLAACGTVKGFGKDVSRAGNEIQKVGN